MSGGEPGIRLRDLQDDIRDVFVARDRQRGVEATFLWLVEEIGELAREVNSDERDAEAIRLELSDVLAWLISLANLLDVDIEDAAARFVGSCPKCDGSPCRCPGR